MNWEGQYLNPSVSLKVHQVYKALLMLFRLRRENIHAGLLTFKKREHEDQVRFCFSCRIDREQIFFGYSLTVCQCIALNLLVGMLHGKHNLNYVLDYPSRCNITQRAMVCK